MTLKESFSILGLTSDANITSVKQAYRRLAFEMHPDLHPEIKDASKNFQRLNEAYVIVTQHLDSLSYSERMKSNSTSSTEKARQDAQRAYKKAKAGESTSSRNVYKEEVLNDILKDPFARRVFEDIYRHIRKEEEKVAGSSSFKTVPEKKVPPLRRSSASATKKSLADSSSVVGKIKGWFRRQIDDEQELRLPKESLRPGAIVRLEIQHGIVGKTHTVELVLPEGYKAGKSIRLKGLGKRVGSVSGDLYVRIIPV